MNQLMQTERLYFREFTLDDAVLLYEMHQDPAITRYTADPIPWDSVERVVGILKDTIMPQYKNKMGRWAVHLKEGDTFIGWCGLKKVGDEIDLGYRFKKQFWGKGYATEAAKGVLEYGVKMELQNIVGRASIANVASVNVLKKIGLVYQKNYQEGIVESVTFVCDVSVLRNMK
ncbi:MAG: GNAT family N-acetyltransferase [Bacteroidota bacterium]